MVGVVHTLDYRKHMQVTTLERTVATHDVKKGPVDPGSHSQMLVENCPQAGGSTVRRHQELEK